MATVDRSATAEHVCGLSASSWWAHARLGSGGQGAWLVRAGELIACFEHLGAAVVRGELTLDHLRSLDEVNDPAVLRELVACDRELCEEALRSPLTRWRRQLKSRVGLIRDDLARRAAAERRAARGQANCHDPASDHDGPDRASEGSDPQSSPGAGQVDGSAGSSSSSGERHREDGPDAGAPFDFPADGATEGCADEPDDEPDDGWASIRPTASDTLRLHIELRGASAELVRQILSAEMSHQRRAAWREHESTGIPVPEAARLRARALVALLQRGASIDLAASAPGRTEAIVVIQADDAAAERVRALDGEPLTSEVASLLSCDAHLRALVVDRRGQPIWLGRTSRLASHAQRRALAIRDGGCVFPGCDMPVEWCDAHHQPGWEHGGTTDIDTMVLLCRRHHGAAHSQRWTLRPSPPPSPPTPPSTRPSDTRPSRSRPSRSRPSPPPRSPTPPSGSSSTSPPRSGPRGSSDQRFEWFDARRGTTVPAQQRGLVRPAA
jgi:hypothetical protein